MAGSTNQARQQSESDYRQRFLDALDAHEALERDAGRRVASLASLLARAGRALGVDGEPKLARQLFKSTQVDSATSMPPCSAAPSTSWTSANLTFLW